MNKKTITVLIIVAIILCCICFSIILILSLGGGLVIYFTTRPNKIMMYKSLVDDDIFELYKELIELQLTQSNIKWTDENYETLRIILGTLIFIMNQYSNMASLSASRQRAIDNERKELLKEVNIESDWVQKHGNIDNEFIFGIMWNKDDVRLKTKEEMISSINENIQALQSIQRQRQEQSIERNHKYLV